MRYVVPHQAHYSGKLDKVIISRFACSYRREIPNFEFERRPFLRVRSVCMSLAFSLFLQRAENRGQIPTQFKPNSNKSKANQISSAASFQRVDS